MKTLNHKISQNGFALITSMIFIVIFGALAVAMLSMSSMNTKLAQNQHHYNQSLSNAFSGLEFVRRNFDGQDIEWPNRLEGLFPIIQSQLVSMTDVSVTYDGADIMDISDVAMSSDGSQSFVSNIEHFVDANDDDLEKLRMKVTGKDGDFMKTLQVDYKFRVGAHSAFDYGVATKGPLSLSGQAAIDGNETDPNLLRIEAGVYIEGVPGAIADSLSMIGQASIAGEVSIYDPNASYDIGTKAVVGGAAPGEANYVTTGADLVDFPVPYPEYFETFATGNVINNANKSTYSSCTEFVNCLIEGGTDFTFASDTVIKGILYIKSPNRVKFAGRVTVIGSIVCEGDYQSSVSGDSVDFAGQVTCMDAATLAGTTGFEELTSDDLVNRFDGTFLLAPGFETDFSGKANFINGVIAANGVSFSGQAGGIVQGSIINYSYDTMVLAGQSELVFVRSGTDTNPAGFVPYSRLEYIPSSYKEIKQ
jgi:hypothetical protein